MGEFLRQLERSNTLQSERERHGTAQDKAFLASHSRATYRFETSVHGCLQEEGRGKPLTPRFIAAIELDIAPTGLDESRRERFRVKVIVLKYIAGGFTIADLGYRASPERWQAIVD